MPHVLADGRYELCEFVSKGGMGAVYRARDVELDRWVAVKCLLDVSKEGARVLALKEARTLASLSHPNIMRVFDILHQPHHNQVWIVSEWLEGKCLAQLPLPLSPAAALAVMAQIYDALSAAHAANVIHRDIKPGNIMIGNDGRVTLIDFGVAFAPGASTGETMVGSLRYTDPRILEGEPPDTDSDLFSAALLQIELMTGETVLPDMAPLPLYRHIKKNLRTRLDHLLDGAYPPLIELARALLTRFERGGAGDAGAAREAAQRAQALLRKLTPLSPEQYLAATLGSGNAETPDVELERTLTTEIEAALVVSGVPPRQKAAWYAFRDHRQLVAEAQALGDDLPLRRTKGIPTPRRRRHRRSALFGSLAAAAGGRNGARLGWTVSVVVLLAVVGMLAGKRRLGEDSDPRPVSPAVAVDEQPVSPEIPPPLLAIEDFLPPLALPSEQVDGAPKIASPDPVAKPTRPEHVALQLVANAWAVVRLDGKEIGRLPQAAPFVVPPGKHELRLENPSVETLTTVIKLDAGKATRLHFNLQPKKARHTLKLSTPGRLYVDGVDHGVVSKKTLSLAYGTHDVRIKRGSRVVRQTSVALGPDSPKDIVLE